MISLLSCIREALKASIAIVDKMCIRDRHTQAINRHLIVCQAHQLFAEDARVHQLDGAIVLISDLGLEFHLVEHLGLQVDARCDFDQGNAFRTQLEYCTLGDVQNGLVYLVGVVAGEGDVLNLLDELLLGAFLRDDELAVLAGGLEALDVYKRQRLACGLRIDCIRSKGGAVRRTAC